MISLYQNTFKTKKDALEFTRTLFRSSVGTHKVGSDIYNYCRSLLIQHPNKNDHSPINIAYFKINKQLNSDSYALTSVYFDGSTDQFSWVSCINGARKYDSVYRTLRDEIKVFVKKYKKSLNWQVSCANCSGVFKREDIQVDHKDIPFKTIATDFQLETPLTDSDCSFNEKYKRHFFVDEKIRHKWQKFHNIKATYQPLCRSCNVKKSNKQ